MDNDNKNKKAPCGAMRTVPDGAFSSIFRTLAVVGDSLSAGEFESRAADGSPGFHDMREYSWGAYLGRMYGIKVTNMARDGMTAGEFRDGWADSMGFFSPARACQAYVIALGINDLFTLGGELGTVDEVFPDEPEKNGLSFAGNLGWIISKFLSIEPRARIFLMSTPRHSAEENAAVQTRRAHRDLLREMCGLFPNTYLLDMFEEFPLIYEEEHRALYMGDHMSPMGYIFMAQAVARLIDRHIRRDPRAFAEVPFIGTGLRYHGDPDRRGENEDENGGSHIMDLCEMFKFDQGEKPLDRVVPNGGFSAIFRTVACIGDSLSSGEFESKREDGENGYHDMFEYSWGQFIARDTGATVHNLSRGGMTAKEYWTNFADSMGYWDPKYAAQAYIIALGVNDLIYCRWEQGSVGDIHPDEPEKNPENFAGYYGRIISRLKKIQPRARFFLMSMPKEDDGLNGIREAHRDLLRDMTKVFRHTYLLDFYEFFPAQTEDYKEFFYTGSHLDPMGYVLTAKAVESYIDYLIRRDPRAFAEVPFIGTELRFKEEI